MCCNDFFFFLPVARGYKKRKEADHDACGCVAVCCSMLQCVTLSCSVLQCVAVCYSVLQCVAVCCSVLQCVAVCCSVLQCVTLCCTVCHNYLSMFLSVARGYEKRKDAHNDAWRCVVVCCSALPRVAVCVAVRVAVWVAVIFFSFLFQEGTRREQGSTS